MQTTRRKPTYLTAPPRVFPPKGGDVRRPELGMSVLGSHGRLRGTWLRRARLGGEEPEGDQARGLGGRRGRVLPRGLPHLRRQHLRHEDHHAAALQALQR